jgi:hypothetical protein
MSYELKRVPVDFDWPLEMLWKGYHNPYQGQECPDCEIGYTDKYRSIEDRVRRIPYEHTDEALSQQDVKTLLEEGYLDDAIKAGVLSEAPDPYEVTRCFEIFGQTPLSPSTYFDFNPAIIVCLSKSRAERREEDIGVFCNRCDGETTIWPTEDIKQRANRWADEEKYDPPEGQGWQVWETRSWGSPVTPVFETPGELIDFLIQEGPVCTDDEVWSREAAHTFVHDEKYVPSALSDGTSLQTGVEALSS